MRYEGIVYRPPSEASSLIIQASIGCSHNKCSFCSMYKDKSFKIRPLEDILDDLEQAKNIYGNIKRIFLADGDALSLKTETLVSILLKIKELFPYIERISIYGTAKDVIQKPIEDLKRLRALGLKMIYLGLESGSDLILKEINKGITSEEMITAGRKVKESGIKLSVTIISGIGGKLMWQEHAATTARVLSSIDPDYVGLLTLMLEEDTPVCEKVNAGIFELLTPMEIMLETKMLLENLNTANCIFRSNHASNYMSLSGTLPWDKQLLLQQIDKAISGKFKFKEEQYRGL